jgi:perosamine synthetase
VVTYFGGRPVLIDCRRDTFNMDETALEQRITSRTRALIPVHIAGQPCELGTILAISQKHGLKVIEDAAHALPARFDGKMIGTVGDITCFSFYATKNITTGEGGMATTADAEYADRMRTMSLHGISGDAWDRYQAEGSWYYEVVDAGFKYNMSDIAAAIGIHQLRNVESFWKRRCEIASRYTRNLADLEAVGVPAVQPLVQHAWHLYIILLSLENLAIDRAQFIEAMKRRNIGTSVHFIPLHMHPYYRKMLDYGPDDFPNAEWVYRRCISLPIYPGMSDRDVDDVTEAVWDIARRHRR